METWRLADLIADAGSGETSVMGNTFSRIMDVAEEAALRQHLLRDAVNPGPGFVITNGTAGTVSWTTCRFVSSLTGHYYECMIGDRSLRWEGNPGRQAVGIARAEAALAARNGFWHARWNIDMLTTRGIAESELDELVRLAAEDAFYRRLGLLRQGVDDTTPLPEES